MRAKAADERTDARAAVPDFPAATGRRAEKARQRAEREKLFVGRTTIDEFQQLEAKLGTFHKDFSALSNKFPAIQVSPIMVKLLNGTLARATGLLGPAQRPFPDFEGFAESALPTNSDVVQILSHYRASMVRFKQAHTRRSSADGKWYWYTRGDELLPG